MSGSFIWTVLVFKPQKKKKPLHTISFVSINSALVVISWDWAVVIGRNRLRMNAEVPRSPNPLRMVQNKLVWLDLTQNKLCLRSLCVTNVQRHLRQSHQVFQSTALLSNTTLLHWYAVAMVTPVPHLTLSDMMPPPPPHFNPCGKVVSLVAPNYKHRFVLTSSLIWVSK